MQVKSYRNEDISTVIDTIKPNYRLSTLDVTSGYHHISVSKEFLKYLGIYWRGKYYMWVVLAFGLSCSGYYFG